MTVSGLVVQWYLCDFVVVAVMLCTHLEGKVKDTQIEGVRNILVGLSRPSGCERG